MEREAKTSLESLSSTSSGMMTPSELASVLLEAFKTLLAESDSYVLYFEQRFRLEEEHLRSLKSMLEKQRELDLRINHKLAVTPGLLPDLNSLSGLRNAWGDMRLSEMWAIDLRIQALLEWKRNTLQPIVQFRDSQERIRRRVKDDLRTCLEDYDEMRITTLPRIRRSYEKRCDDLEFYRHQQRAIEEQRQLLSVSSEPRTSNDPPSQDSIRSVQENSSPSDRVNLPSPRELSPNLEAQAGSTSTFYSPNQANTNSVPSSQSQPRTNFLDGLRKKEAWDGAPKRLNALFTRMLDVSGEKNLPAEPSLLGAAAPVTDGPTSGSSPVSSEPVGPAISQKSQQVLAVKQAKAKRDVDEADKAYRKAIFDLETLRIRLTKTLAAAVTSILEWRKELAITMHKACLQQVHDSYTVRNSIETVHKQDEQIATRMLDRIDAEQRMCEDWLPSTRSLIQEQRVQYVNFWHGPYKDLIFGTGLVDYAFSHGQAATPSTMTDSGLIAPSVRPPLIVTKCIKFMEQPRCIKTPGIYRLSAKYSRVQELTSQIEQDETQFQFDTEREEAVMVASILKLYLRQLPEPVMPMRWEERMRYTHDRDEHRRNQFTFFKSRIRRMPPIHQATLRALLMHLSNVAMHADHNKMTVANLALIFSPVILSESNLESTSLAAATEEDRTLEDLIVYWSEIYSVPPVRNEALPPIPRNEDKPTLRDASIRRKQVNSWDGNSTPQDYSYRSNEPYSEARAGHAP
ncbi:hypothetical protein MYAM1_000943 [Malassezia yamatoensis]|uniref:Rho-GAP domain-containing protein n=1 Tax=Malassezia yamatoensis TaxID=253288 RepID=A0AAJ6CGZ7_9BASI|nr:hypothetical protein MYAM1_000943 [Malassezia yamatoensis]